MPPEACRDGVRSISSSCDAPAGRPACVDNGDIVGGACSRRSAGSRIASDGSCSRSGSSRSPSACGPRRGFRASSKAAASPIPRRRRSRPWTRCSAASRPASPRWRSSSPATRCRRRALASRPTWPQALSGLTPGTVPGLKTIQTYATTGDKELLSRDGKAALAVLVFDVQSEQVQTELGTIRSNLKPTPLHTYVTGEPAVYEAISDLSASDLRKAESYALPFALVVLVLVFGSLVAASLPVIGGALAVSVTLGAMYLIAPHYDLSIFVMNVASMLGLAVGIDYSLFIVGRFREELAAGATVGGRRAGDGRHRRPGRVLQRRRRRGRPPGSRVLPLHVAALDGHRRLRRRALLRTLGAHTAAGAAGTAGSSREFAAGPRSKTGREPVLAALVGLGHGPSRRRAHRHGDRDPRAGRPRAAHHRQRADGDRAAEESGGPQGLRHHHVPVRPRPAVSRPRPAHLGRRAAGSLRAGQPGEALRVRPAPRDAARRAVGHEHREPARHHVGTGRHRLLADRGADTDARPGHPACR